MMRTRVSDGAMRRSGAHGNDRRLAQLRWASIGMELFLAVGAVAGGLALMAGPKGEILPLPVSALAGSMFADYVLPGAVLFTVLGLGPLAGAVLAWRRHSWAPFLAFSIGVALLVWLTVQIAVVGYSSEPPLQAFYLGLAVLMTATGAAWMHRSTPDDPRARPCHPRRGR